MKIINRAINAFREGKIREKAAIDLRDAELFCFNALKIGAGDFIDSQKTARSLDALEERISESYSPHGFIEKTFYIIGRKYAGLAED